MQTLDAMLDALAERAGSDRKIGPMLGASTQAPSMWRTRRAFPDDDKARRIAELLDLDPAFVLAVIHGERAKSKETRAAWHRVAQAFAKAAALAVVAVAPALTSPDAQARFNTSGNCASFDGPKYTMSNRRRRRSTGSAFAAAVARLLSGPHLAL